jgi:hypothetical protein
MSVDLFSRRYDIDPVIAQGDRRGPESVVDHHLATNFSGQVKGQGGRVSFYDEIQVSNWRIQQHVSDRTTHQVNGRWSLHGASAQGAQDGKLATANPSLDGIEWGGDVLDVGRSGAS